MRGALLVLAGLCACHSPPPASQQPDGGTHGVHPTPGPGIAAAWQIDDPKDLVAGPNTAGRVGDWTLANSRVRVVIEDARPSDGYDPYGCNIAAADRVRAAGEPGQSRFGEVWMGLNFRAAGCDSMTLVNDGSDGEPAVIRGTGKDDVSPFMASLFHDGIVPPSLHATIFREFSLAPDSDVLQLNLAIRNDGNEALDLAEAYLGMAMNRGLRHWVDKSGFDFDTTVDGIKTMNSSAAFYAAVGEDVSYSVLNLDAPFSPILNFANVLIGQYPAVHLAPGQAKTFRFAFAIGTGDTASLQAAHQQVQRLDLGALGGKVVDVNALPVARARVHVTNIAGDQVFAFVRTAADGSWSAPLPSGTYTVRALADDRDGSPPTTYSTTAAGAHDLLLQVGASARIEAKATDDQGHALPAKIVLEPAGAGRPSFPPALGEDWPRQPIVIFSADGTASVPVFPGPWHVTFSRGFEYDRPLADLTVAAGQTGLANATLTRVVDTTGWVSGDYHVHAQGSPDADDLMPLKVRSFAAEGVEIPVSTEHEFIGDFGPAVRALGLSPFMHSIPGTEMTTTVTGHFNIFPLTPMPSLPNEGAFQWFNRTIPDVMAEARARTTPWGGAPILQMNHPRSPGMSYLDTVGFNPDTFVPDGQGAKPQWMTEWDAMELWDGEGLARIEGCPYAPLGCHAPAHPQLFDWFAFLARGKRVAGLGNSDSHTSSTSAVGYPRTLLKLGGDDPAAVTDEQVAAAIRAGKATVSGGPFLVAYVNGVGPGGTAGPDAQGKFNLTLDLQAPKWMGKLSRIDVWVGDTGPQGASLQQSIDLTSGTWVDTGANVRRIPLTASFPLTVTRDTFVVVTVRGPVDADGVSNALWPVVQTPMPPYAITNPVWIDVNGNGFDPLR